MTTRFAVTKCLNLITIRALTTTGRFIWSAKTWAYMSHANGPWYTLGPLFIAGLAATAVISILPAAQTDAGQFVYLAVTPTLGYNEISCVKNNVIQPGIYCTGAEMGVNLLQAYSHGGFATSVQDLGLSLQGQVTSNRTLGYPWDLVNNRIVELDKYNASSDLYQESNKTACVWVLDKTPMRCSWTNYTGSGAVLNITSPYSGEVYSINNFTDPPQGISVGTVDGLSEIAGTGSFGETQLETAYVCTTRAMSDVHVGRYITTKWSGFVTNTFIDLANSSSCQPTY